MTADEADRDQVTAALEYRLAVAEESLRALLAGGVDAIVMGAERGEQRIYTLETEDRPYRRLVERMSEGAALVAADGLIVYANERLASLLGVPLERLLGGPFSDWLDEPERAPFIAQLAAGTSGHAEHTARRPDGTGVPVLVGLNTTEGSSGSLRCLIVTDLSQQKAQQQQVHRLNAKLTEQVTELHRINSDLEDAERLLTHRTLHDPLTGLPNRTLFVNRLEQSLANAARTGHPVAVSFIDLDAFKRVNDTLGHAAGDRLLQEVAERLSTVVRPNDTVARFAGDEFLVLTIGAASGLPVALADRLLGALHDPPLRAGAETVTASMGLAVSYEGVAPEQLLREADAAMYHAKRAGGARWELFGSRLRDELRYRRTAEQRLRKALAGDGVRVLYQPIVDLADGRPVGEVHDGLVEDPHAVAGQGLAQALLGGTPVPQLVAQPRAEQLPAGPAGSLRVVHRGVGLAQQLLGGDALVADCQPHAGGDRLGAGPQRGVVQRAEQPVCQGDGQPGSGPDGEHEELVAGEPRDRVVRSHDGGQPFRDLLEQPVARGVPEGVVDPLEGVEA